MIVKKFSSLWLFALNELKSRSKRLVHNRLSLNIPLNIFPLSVRLNDCRRVPFQGNQLNSFQRQTASAVELDRSSNIKLGERTSVALTQKSLVSTFKHDGRWNGSCSGLWMRNCCSFFEACSELDESLWLEVKLSYGLIKKINRIIKLILVSHVNDKSRSSNLISIRIDWN